MDIEAFSIKKTEFLQLEKWLQKSNHLIAGFTTRNGGVSKGAFSSMNCGLHVHDHPQDVVRNREHLASIISFPLESWVMGEQVHSSNVYTVQKNEKGSGARDLETALKRVDGLVTKEKDILLAALFADCIPLFFYDPVKEIIGIAHAGWKGTVQGIANEMVQAFKEQGSCSDHIQVTIGPGISKSFYEVDDKIFQAVDKKYRKKVFTQKENSRYLLDLKELNSEILLHSGILRHNIDITNYCTYKDETLFFSHRRDQGKTGRMLGFIGLRA